jgi:hypothetical protein
MLPVRNPSSSASRLYSPLLSKKNNVLFAKIDDMLPINFNFGHPCGGWKIKKIEILAQNLFIQSIFTHKHHTNIHKTLTNPTKPPKRRKTWTKNLNETRSKFLGMFIWKIHHRTSLVKWDKFIQRTIILSLNHDKSITFYF